MRKAWFYLLAASIAFLAAQTAFASVVINEVLFNPSALSNPGDTGLEKIELYNNGSSSVDVTGWELYPDGIGYFVFPQGFAIQAKSFVAVHLHLQGANDLANLYHSGATNNMSDSSGSVALFSAPGHPDGSIIDFVRYHKPGSSEKKTWESTAAKAGLWTAGEFMDITALQAGSSIGLNTDGVRVGALSWNTAVSPTIGGQNSGVPPAGGEQQSQQSEQQTPFSEDSPISDSGRSVPPSLKAYAGKDHTVAQGSLVEFKGSADGINGEPLISARFLWNFGDGTTKEGKLISHVYYFPGVYTVSLDISSGEYAGSDYVKVTVVRPDILISEIKGGERGFIEIYNSTVNGLDLGGFQFKDGFKSFSIPKGTFIQPNSTLVFPNAVTGLFQNLEFAELRDAFGFVIDAGYFSEPLLIEESFERTGSDSAKFVKIKSPTPGAYVVAVLHIANTQDELVVAGADLQTKDIQSDTIAGNQQKDIVVATGVKKEAAVVASVRGSASSAWFLGISIALGVIAAGGFLFFKFF
ncbi:MAG: lamin tail domain-containing protein [bacterium]|nr:lamin tail domain-containing protein [bacterium]